jgi:hypothetical protein
MNKHTPSVEFLVSRLREQHQLLETLSEEWERQDNNVDGQRRIGIELEAIDAEITATQKLLNLYWAGEIHKAIQKLEESGDVQMAKILRSQLRKGN